MGQKVHPKGLRIGIIRDWDSRWYARQDFAGLLQEDMEIRRYIKKKLYDAGISRVEIERAASRIKIVIHAAKPGMVIGRGGSGIEQLRGELEQLTRKQVSINIAEVKNPELEAQLLAESVAAQLERRISFRRAIKQAAQRAMRAGARGVKVMVSGRLGGAEMSRTEWTAEGSVPLHTLRVDVDYGFAEAFTTYGQIGVKVWINRGTAAPLRPARGTRTGAGERAEKAAVGGR